MLITLPPKTQKINYQPKKNISFSSAKSVCDSFSKTKTEEKKPTFFEKLFSRKPKNKEYIKEGQFLTQEGRVFNRHTTCFFRNDLDWREFAELLKQKFSNNSKVNAYIWGCSYGDEAYSLSMILKRKFKKESEKFYPIIAKDISSKVIETAKKEQQEGIPVNAFSKTAIKSILKISDKDEEKMFKPWDKIYSKLNDDIVKKIQFSKGNIVSDIDSMDKNNPSIVMCRNMWPYINPLKYRACAEQMYEKLAKGSLVVIGNYDYFGELGYLGSKNFPKELVKAGFEPLLGLCCAEKNSLDEDELKNYALVYEKV